MAKKHLINTGRWSRPRLYKLKTAEKKLVIEYLLSNPLTSRSGIFTIYSGTISSGIGEHIINSEKVKEVLIQLDKLGLILYDGNEHIVKIRNFHQYVPFGSGKPVIIASELLTEFEECKHHESDFLKLCWFTYVEENFEKLKELEERLKKSKANTEKISIEELLKLKLPK